MVGSEKRAKDLSTSTSTSNQYIVSKINGAALLAGDLISQTTMIMARVVLFFALLVGTDAWGKKDKQGRELDEAEHMQEAEYDEHARQMGAREYEIENLKRRKNGEIDDAQLGVNNLANAMNDPGAMAEMAQLMKDPASMAKVQQMMQDPTFQAQAKAAVAQMQASGGMPDMSQMQKMMQDPEVMRKAQAMAQAMGMGGAGGGGGMGGMGAGGAEAELARLRAENARLKQGFA